MKWQYYISHVSMWSSNINSETICTTSTSIHNNFQGRFPVWYCFSEKSFCTGLPNFEGFLSWLWIATQYLISNCQTVFLKKNYLDNPDVYKPVSASVCLSAFLFFCVSICLSVILSLSVCPSYWRSDFLPTFLPTCHSASRCLCM